jgi:hypothetical protein
MVYRSLSGEFLLEPSTSNRVRCACKNRDSSSVTKSRHWRALDREHAQQLQLTGHVDQNPLLLRIQQMGNPSQMLNPEMK